MALSFEPTSPWHLVATAMGAVVVVALLARLFVDRWLVFARRWPVRLLILLTSVLACAALPLAAWNPVLTAKPDPNRLHVVVVADVSGSVLRTDGGWPAARERAAKLLAALVDALPDDTRAQSTASIVTFQSNVSIFRKSLPLGDLARQLLQLQPGDFATGTGSNLGAGLNQARELIEQANVQGSVVLLSDGHENEGLADGGAQASAQRLARQGIAVHVLPIASGQPELAISAANLPPSVESEARTFLRGNVVNGRDRPVQASVTSAKYGETVESPPPISMELDAGKVGRLRQPIQFVGLGLQFVDLTLTPSDGQGEHRRRLFTHVTRPPRVLSIGGDHRWINALPAGAAKVEQLGPRDLVSADQLRDVDAVVIGSVSADQLAPGTQTLLDQAVRESGLGLMLINGNHEGADPEGPTVLASYTGTPIGELLPVEAGPRPFTQEAPTRQVVIMIDASGSMGGWPLDKAKEIASYVIQQRMRPQDRLDVLVFTSGSLQIVKDQAMDDAGKRYALDQVSRIQVGGGTDPTEALRVIAGRQLKNCGLLFLSDGEFASGNARPECRTTAFVIGSSSVSPGSAMAQLGDVVPVPRSFNPASITMPYFEPDKRTRFFEPGQFVPAQTDALARPGGRPTVPTLPMDGSAVSHAKDDADVFAVRPRLTDPLLAVRAAGNGQVAVFAGAVPAAWTGQNEAGRAVASWIDAIIPYAARDRYDFHLADRGDRIDVRVAMLPHDGRVPSIQSLGGRVEIAGRPPSDVAFRQVPDLVATFAGTIRVPRDAAAQQATLVIEEAGQDALRRAQRVPLVIPPAGAVNETVTSEAFNYGLNEPLLRRLAEVTGGVYDIGPRDVLVGVRRAAPPGDPLWPWVLVAGAASYAVAIVLQRLNL